MKNISRAIRFLKMKLYIFYIHNMISFITAVLKKNNKMRCEK